MVKERISILAREDCKLVDDAYMHFGTRDEPAALNTWDSKLGYNLDEQRLELVLNRPAETFRGACTFDEAGGADDDLWSTDGTPHGLTTEDKAQFVAAGTGASGFAVKVQYFVNVISTTTFQLATSAANATAGTQITGTGDSSGTWTLAAPNRDGPSYAYGLNIFDEDADEDSRFFIGGPSQKTYMLRLSGERPALYPAVSDSHDGMIKVDFTNRAVNDASFTMRGINLEVQNRASGELGALEAVKAGWRLRGDSGAMTNVRAFYIAANMDVGATVPSAQVEGIRLECKYTANMPAYDDATGGVGILVEQITDGVYTPLPGAAFAVRNRGTSGCKGFTYGIDFYDSRAATCDIGEIRFMTADGNDLPAVMVSGSATDDAGIRADIGADTLWADGSLYVSVSDGAGKLFVKTADVWTSCI